MITKELTCILCPMGCRLTAQIEDGAPIVIQGNTCPRGAKYGEQELTNPMRVVTSTVRVIGSATYPMCPVKTAKQVPKRAIEQVIGEIRALRARAPISIGQVLIPDIANTGVSLVATANRSEEEH